MLLLQPITFIALGINISLIPRFAAITSTIRNEKHLITMTPNDLFTNLSPPVLTNLSPPVLTNTTCLLAFTHRHISGWFKRTQQKELTES